MNDLLLETLLWLALVPLLLALVYVRRVQPVLALPRPARVVEPPSRQARVASGLAALKHRARTAQVQFDLAAPDTTLQPGARPDHRQELLTMLVEPVEAELEIGQVVFRGELVASPARLVFTPAPPQVEAGQGCLLTYRAGGSAWQVYSRVEEVDEAVSIALPTTVSSANERSGGRIGVAGLLTLVQEGVGAPVPVLDISSRGLAVSCHDPAAFPRGARLRVAVLLDGAPLVSSMVDVRHLDDDGRVGLRFVGDGARAEMRDVLQTLRG